MKCSNVVSKCVIWRQKLYIVLYNPCKHPCALHKCLHNKQVQILLMMEIRACDCSNKPYVGGGILF